jgi:ribonuclease BN (tRNA processing enzyme)
MTEEEISILEQKNAKIDVLIDEEKYSKIDEEIKYTIDLSKCFDEQFCTKDAEDAWLEVLTIANPALKLLNVEKSNEDWMRLFYAKLLRSKIQQRGTDCYFSRLDQLVNYLEKYIPNPHENKKKAKLAVLYLLELSAASLTYESLGFSERARRILDERINPNANEVDKCFSWFYELLIRYNNGIAHLHLSNYREAVLEFNGIIFEIKKLKDSGDNKDKSDFYRRRNGDSLLFFSSIVRRAEIQLIQQLAYHALKTLSKYSGSLDKQKYRHTGHVADLIRIQAYQLLGELKEAGTLIKKLWEDLFGEKQNFPYFNKKDQMISAKAFETYMFPGTEQQNIKGRLMSLSIDQHLNCLRRQKEIILQEETETKVKHEKLSKWINNHVNYLEDLGRKSFVSYFSAVEFEEYGRQGYWEQVTDFLGWLAEINKLKNLEVNTTDRVRKLTTFCFELVGIIKGKKLIEYLFEKSPREVEEKKWDCRWCTPKGVDLIGLQPNHYDNFTRNMIKVLDTKLLNIKDDQYEEFIKRLLHVEERRYDLRIKDLELRYKSNGVTGALPPIIGNSKEYCWRDISPEKRIEFKLLPCELNSEQRNKLEAPITQEDDLQNHPHKRYEQVMQNWDDHFLSHLESPSLHERQEPGLYFLGLQRWNSSSPAEGYSLGGGYLIYRLDRDHRISYGIAIDPGFDFIRNLFHMGFSLNDIDIIIISHAHIDHIRDFESIVTLLLELKKRKDMNRKVHVILTLGTYKRLEYIIENSQLRMHIEPYIIDIDREIEIDYFEDLPNDKVSFCFQPASNTVNRLKPIIIRDKSSGDSCEVKISPTRAYHDDYTQYSDSFGFLINIHRNGENEVSIGYTGDTKWVYKEIIDPIKGERINKVDRKIKDIVKQYENCDTIIVHLGSLINKNKEDDRYNFLKYWACERENECEQLVRKEGHPYLIGLLRILTSLYNESKVDKPLVFVSEFGEELRGKIRVDLVQRLVKVYGNKMNILPMDVGINVQLQQDDTSKHSTQLSTERKILCVQCERLLPLGEARFEHYGQDEAIYCVCKTCLVGTPLDVLQNRLRQLYEVGYELHASKRKLQNQY